MPKTMELTQIVVFESCFTCGIPIAMTEGQKRRYDESGMSIVCVLGHQTIRRESENQRLAHELQLAQDRLAQAETARRSAELTLDSEIKKRRQLLKRVSAGVCPHCHRTFQQLDRHMKSKHS